MIVGGVRDDQGPTTNCWDVGGGGGGCSRVIRGCSGTVCRRLVCGRPLGEDHGWVIFLLGFGKILRERS